MINVDDLHYCGKEAQEIFSKEVYSLDIANYGITLMDGVKGKQKIYNGEIGDVWQAYSCPFTPNGEVVLSEDYIEPAEIKVNLEECYDAFWPTFMVEQTKITLDGGVPQAFTEWFFNEKLTTQMKKEYQAILWKGDKAYTGATKQYLKVTDGVEKVLSTKSGVVTGTSTAFTVNNVLTQVEAAVMDAIDNANAKEVDTDNFKIFLNAGDVRLLKVALGKLNNGNSVDAIFQNYAKEGEKIFIMGYEVVPTEQSKSTIIVGPAKNIVLGFDTFDSHIEYKMLDMREHTGDNTFRVIALSNIAVGVVYPELFTFYHL